MFNMEDSAIHEIQSKDCNNNKYVGKSEKEVEKQF